MGKLIIQKKSRTDKRKWRRTSDQGGIHILYNRGEEKQGKTNKGGVAAVSDFQISHLSLMTFPHRSIKFLRCSWYLMHSMHRQRVKFPAARRGCIARSTRSSSIS